jgi:hypothetical protein
MWFERASRRLSLPARIIPAKKAGQVFVLGVIQGEELPPILEKTVNPSTLLSINHLIRQENRQKTVRRASGQSRTFS